MAISALDKGRGELAYQTSSPPNASDSANSMKTKDSGDTHLTATLQRIDALANEDVEMAAPPGEASAILVIDTNILLHHFDAISQFVKDATGQHPSVLVVIPGIVVYELDGQKNREGLAWFARRASTWLLERVEEKGPRVVKVQAKEETEKESGNWKSRDLEDDLDPEQRNDDLIIDCCKYFGGIKPTALCSADKNIMLKAEGYEIPHIRPSKNWSSREIAFSIFGNSGFFVNFNDYQTFEPSYRDLRTHPKSVSNEVQTKKPKHPPLPREDDGMDIDMGSADPAEQEGEDQDSITPSHALDLLHLQVIQYFTRLLVELVARVGDPPISNGIGLSAHAPEWQRQTQHYSKWDAAILLEYLNDQKPIPVSNPRLEAFFSRPYSRRRGCRRGQDWSRRDWEVALGALGELGESWGEISIGEGLHVLDRHFKDIFSLKMRPTGT